MKDNDNAIAPLDSTLSAARHGLGWGLLGVTAFSFTVPLTRIAVGGLSPLLIGAGRAVVAAALAALALAITRQRLPRGGQWARLAVVAGGIVLGFPLLTSYALTVVPATHGAVVTALLPAATAVGAVLRGRERPQAPFWIMSVVGACIAVGFAVHGSASGGTAGGTATLTSDDLLLFAAVVAGSIGYAEGGLLARELGAWQTVSWALVIAAPLTTVLAIRSGIETPPTATPAQWAAFAYLSVVSMFLGFFAWYRGLAIGPIARVSQVQLVQPVLSIGWAALLLGEPLTWPVVLGAVAVIGCAAAAVRTRTTGSPDATPPANRIPARL